MLSQRHSSFAPLEQDDFGFSDGIVKTIKM